ncbi:MAG: EamA family transporter [bacterium]|nr:EamA family transporter [bacterium]
MIDERPAWRADEPAARAKRIDLAGVALVSCSACGFATLGIFGKGLLHAGLDLPSTLAWRFAGAALLLWIWLIARRRWRLPLRQAATAFTLGAVGYAIQSALYFLAIERISVGLTSLLLYTYPAFVALLAWLVEHEPPSRRRLAALIVAFAGTSLAANPHGPRADLLGLAIGVGMGLWYAAYLILSARLVRSVDSLTASAYVCLGAATSFIAVALATGVSLPRTSAAGLMVLGIVVVATVVPIVALFAGIRRLGTPRAAVLSTLEPVVTVALGALILGERLGPLQLTGGALIVAALVLLQVPQRASTPGLRSVKTR